MSGKVTGRVFIKINGSLQESMEGAKLTLGGIKREPVVGNSVYGYTESVEASTLEFDIAHKADTDLPAINALVGATLTFETDTGVTYIIPNAFCTKPCEVAQGGKAPLAFAGDPAIQA